MYVLWSHWVQKHQQKFLGLVFHFAQSILKIQRKFQKNTKEKFENYYFTILSYKIYSKLILSHLFSFPEVLTHLLTPILPYLYMACVGWHICVKHGLFGIFDINDTYGIQFLSCLGMGIWVSKDASGPQKCRLMPLNSFWIG